MRNLIKDAFVIALFGLLALFCAARAFGQPQAPPVVPMPPQAPPVKAETPTPKIVYVATRARQIPGTIAIRDDEWYARPAIVVYPLGYGKGTWLNVDASDADIAAAIAGRQVQASPAPFVESSSRGQAGTADDSYHDPGSLPDAIREMLASGTKYKRARLTQRSYNQGERTDPVSRVSLEAKWNVPGGMVGVHGWKSDLYKYVPVQPREWLGWLKVANGILPPRGNGWQWERSWQRSYPDGSWFADVLSRDRKVFEVRVREKNEGQWENYVAFKDKNARPEGYTGLRDSCIFCHRDSGSGEYGVGLVPGGDETISDPIRALER